MFAGFFANYYNNPMLKHRETFEEFVARVGIETVFSGTQVDDSTMELLHEYFLLDRLNAPEKRFLWLFRRRLNSYYPIYKDSIDMWAERKTKEWFFDNYKTESVEHDGNGNMTENLTSELNRVLERVFNGIHNGTTSDTVTDDGESSENYGENRTGENENSTNASEKDRAFAFRYPESNYTAQVIPYDLNDNPVVEFIDNQSDTVRKSDTNTNGSDSSEMTGDRSGTTSNKRQANGTQDATDEQTTKDNGTDTQNADRKQNTTEHWEEERRRQGDNINSLVNDLLSQIPQTDFFRQFVVKLTPCFQSTYLVDEFIEEDDRYDGFI